MAGLKAGFWKLAKTLWFTVRPAFANLALQSLRWLADFAGLLLAVLLVSSVIYGVAGSIFFGEPSFQEIESALRAIQENWIGVPILAGTVLVGPIHKFASNIRKAAGMETAEPERTEEDRSPSGRP